MRGAALVLAAGLLLAAGAAQAENDSDALVQFGLIGSSALDCHSPPSPTNPFVNFTFSDAGQPMRQIVTGKPQYDSLVPLSDLVLIDADHLQFSYPQGGVTVTIVLLKEQNRFRPYRAVASNGTISVEDGVVKSSGQPTSWLHKCGE
jgi:hypothetical protein